MTKKPRKIRVGIDLDHVMRNVNRQIVKFYARDIDPSIDVDEVDCKDDVIKKVCHFKSKMEVTKFLYEDYPLEVFGNAPQVSRNISRDLNMWIEHLTNQEEYDVEFFFYSMKEINLTIQSSYFFLARIGSRVRKTVFPRTLQELSEMGDIFITAYDDTAKAMKKAGKGVIFIEMNFNGDGKKYADLTYGSFRDFLDDDEKLDKLAKISDRWQNSRNREESFSIWRAFLSLFSRQTRRG